MENDVRNMFQVSRKQKSLSEASGKPLVVFFALFYKKMQFGTNNTNRPDYPKLSSLKHVGQYAMVNNAFFMIIIHKNPLFKPCTLIVFFLHTFTQRK
jgi:hypothetical protein